MNTLLGSVLVGVLTLTACAGAQIARMQGESASERYRTYAGEPVDSFTAFNIDGWTPVSDHELVVRTGVNDAYLIMVRDNCRDLQSSERIGIRQTGSSVTQLDQVRVGRDRCPISSIRPLDMEQMRADRAAAAAAVRAE